jgi:pyridoxine kinase
VAVDYTVECISTTLKDPEHNKYGVNFEKVLPYLIDRLNN